MTFVSIPDSVTSIDDSYAFADCTGLTFVSIPYSVTSIGGHAFQGCTGLNKIKFAGTINQWKVIQRGNNWHEGVKTAVVNCDDGNCGLDDHATPQSCFN